MGKEKRGGIAWQMYLAPDEQVLWVGQPDPSIIFHGYDVLTVPLSLIWVAYLVGGWRILLHLDQVSFFTSFVVGLISFVSFDVVFGRFVIRWWRKRHTAYVITDYRILMIEYHVFKKSAQTHFLDAIPAVHIHWRRRGVGSLTFDLPAAPYPGRGNYFLRPEFGSPIPGFYDIHDVEEVHQFLSSVVAERKYWLLEAARANRALPLHKPKRQRMLVQP